MTMLEHTYNIIIDHDVGSTGHEREVVYALDDTGKRFLLMLMTIVWLSGAADYVSQMVMYTTTMNTYISLAREFQKHISYQTRKNYAITEIIEYKFPRYPHEIYWHTMRVYTNEYSFKEFREIMPENLR